MDEARRFKLVLLLKMLGCLEAQRELAEVVDSVIALGLLDFLDSHPPPVSHDFAAMNGISSISIRHRLCTPYVTIPNLTES